jgi:acyl-CoA synthetase (AMP-forming)/AMP-acid ligase II
MSNLATLIVAAAKSHPQNEFGTLESSQSLADAASHAASLARHLQSMGLGRGTRWALVGRTGNDYMLTWLASQLAGVELALINPEYPDDLLGAMLDDLQPAAIAWLDRPAGDLASRSEPQLDLRNWWDTHRAQSAPMLVLDGLDGLACDGGDIASYIHTSGTTGRPKFCALSHEYLLRLGRFIADTLVLGAGDRVFAPLPMFHINPLGYGLIGSLTARASILGTEKFSASKFWPTVRERRITALISHTAPSIILATSTTPDDAKGHGLRVAFGMEATLCGLFGIPVGVGGYGSTESAGLSHAWHFRAGDKQMAKEGISNYSGRGRHDVGWTISPDGEIMTRDKVGRAIFSGYVREGTVVSPLDPQGWFHTGDKGRMDEYGNLVFIERMNEAIRVKGEYVPIDFVETTLTQCPSLGNFALWRVDSATSGHEVVIYTESDTVSADEVRAAIEPLPRFMRPSRVIRVTELPRTGVGKVQRGQLNALIELTCVAL